MSLDIESVLVRRRNDTLDVNITLVASGGGLTVRFEIPVDGVNSLDQAVEQARQQVRQFAANLVRTAEQKFF